MIWNNAMRAEYLERSGEPKSIESMCFRRSGRSTEIAFRIFAQTYKNPDTWIPIVDHWDQPEMNRRLAFEMREMASKLGFTFRWKKEGRRHYVQLRVEGKAKEEVESQE